MAGWRSVSRSCRGLRPGRARALGLAAVAAALWSPTAAAELPAPEAASGRQVWAGADVSANVWLLYSGVTLAPWSPMHDDGFRFRAAGGYGEYSYKSWSAAGGTTLDTYEARTYFADLLIGYLKRLGDLTAKAFIGISTISHDIAPSDPQTLAIGDDVGIKGVVELWLNMGERGWSSLDLSWSSAHDTRAVRTRVGYRFWPKLSLGLEGGLNVDAQGQCRMTREEGGGCYPDEVQTDRLHTNLLDYARAGAFARYEWDTGEVSLSAGVLGDKFSRNADAEFSPYVTVNWLTQF